MGWRIFTHSITMIFNNFSAAVRISGLLWVVTFGISRMFTTANVGSIGTGQPSFANGGIAIITLIVTSIAAAWIAVGWHRFILKSEYPGTWIPTMRRTIVLRYIWTGFLLGLLLVAVLVPVAIVSVLFVTLLKSSGMAVLPILSVLLASYVIYRLSLVLPAVAIDDHDNMEKTLTFKESWRATAGISGALLLLVIVTVVPFGLFEFVSSNLEFKFLALIWDFCAGWLQMMISISVLTTLYGLLIEKRELI